MATKARKATKPKKATKAPSVAAAIRRLDAEFMRAAHAKDAGALVAAFYASDAVLMPPNRPSVQGRSSIRAFLQGLIDGGLSSIRLQTTRIESAGDLAYGRGTYALAITPPGGATVQDSGKYVVVYRRKGRGGSWQAVADIFNSDQAAPPAGASSP